MSWARWIIPTRPARLTICSRSPARTTRTPPSAGWTRSGSPACTFCTALPSATRMTTCCWRDASTTDTSGDSALTSNASVLPFRRRPCRTSSMTGPMPSRSRPVRRARRSSGGWASATRPRAPWPSSAGSTACPMSSQGQAGCIASGGPRTSMPTASSASRTFSSCSGAGGRARSRARRVPPTLMATAP